MIRLSEVRMPKSLSLCGPRWRRARIAMWVCPTQSVMLSALAAFMEMEIESCVPNIFRMFPGTEVPGNIHAVPPGAALSHLP